jgi:hypothetical protein
MCVDKYLKAKQVDNIGGLRTLRKHLTPLIEKLYGLK